MTPFNWCFPTKLIFGQGRVCEVGTIAAQYGKKVMIATYTPGSALDPVINKVKSVLLAAGLDVTVFAGIEPNPRTQAIDKVVEIFNAEKCDLIIALGGGSIIDASKYIAATAFSGGKSWDYVTCNEHVGREYTGAFPIITIPTVSASGSEVNASGVIKNTETKEKTLSYSPYYLPKVAIVDPEILASVPLRLTQDSCIDIFSHLVELYLCDEDESEFSDRTTEGMILCVKDNFEKVLDDLGDAKVRGELALCSVYSRSNFKAREHLGCMSMHAIQMPLSAHYDLPHGRGMVIIIPAYLEYLADVLPHRWAKLARRCFGVTETDDSKAAKMLSTEVVKWFKSTNSFLTLGDVSIPDEKFKKMAQDAVRIHSVNRVKSHKGARSVSAADVLAIYKLCK